MVEITARLIGDLAGRYRTEYLGQFLEDSSCINTLTEGLEALLRQYLTNPVSTSEQQGASLTYVPIGKVVNFGDVYFDNLRYYVGGLGSSYGGGVTTITAKMLRRFLENEGTEYTTEELGKIAGTKSPHNHLQNVRTVLSLFSADFLIVNAGHGTGKYKLRRKGLNSTQM